MTLKADSITVSREELERVDHALKAALSHTPRITLDEALTIINKLLERK